MVAAGISVVLAVWILRGWYNAVPAQKATAITKADAKAQTNSVQTDTLSSSQSFRSRISSLAATGPTPQQVATLLKVLYAKDPDGLFETLLGIGQAPVSTQRQLVPLLAEALILWPEAEGRYIFPVADAFGNLDISSAAEWGAVYLTKTGRTELAATSLVGRLAEISDGRALALAKGLPDASRREAAMSIAYHIPLGDLNHLMEVCARWDSNDSSIFSKQVFERLGMEHVDETAAWLATTPDADRIPGAAIAIGEALVRDGKAFKAINWADSLSDQAARGQAISAVYQEWARSNPQGAIQDILEAYDGTPQLMADIFIGAADHHGSGPLSHWGTACGLQNPSARAYAVAALIEPMLTTHGLAETQAKIATLTAGSVEQNVAQLTLEAALKKPQVKLALENRP